MEQVRTRVLCVDDSVDLVVMLARMINGQPDLENVGGMASADGLSDEVERRRPDVVVLDLNMPGSPPLAAIRELAVRAPQCRVITYSGHDDDATICAALDAGAWEHISKNRDPFDILHAIRRVAARPAA
jgi:DNA-binding NarL/FixJ family response regulator